MRTRYRLLPLLMTGVMSLTTGLAHQLRAEDQAPATATKTEAPQPQAATAVPERPKPPAGQLLTPEQLDALVAKHLPAGTQLQPISEAEYQRRVTLDLIGRQPSPAEADEFQADTAADKRAKLVERLLASPEFGANWANYWSDTISYRVPPPELTFLNYDRLKGWMADKLNTNRPWDEVVRELLTASGKVKEHPPASFVAFHGGNSTKLAAETTRIFLGLQLECAQCHDHPFEDWKREEYHSLVSFFARAEAKLPHNNSDETVVKDKGKGEHEMPNVAEPNKKGEIMQPVTLTGEKIPLGATDSERRKTLATWVTSPENPWFPRAYVNRVWARLMGEGFTEPVDNIGATQMHKLADLHDALAGHFLASKYDPKAVLRVIVNSQAYGRGLRLIPDPHADPLVAATAGRVRGDEVFQSLVTAIELPNRKGIQAAPTPEIRFPPPPKSTRDIVAETFGFDPSLKAEEIVRTLQQAMLLMNNDQILSQVDGRSSSGTLLSRWLEEIPDDKTLTTRLYRRLLARDPTEAEVQIAVDHIASVGDRTVAFEDLLWSLINSTEFTTRR